MKINKTFGLIFLIVGFLCLIVKLIFMYNDSQLINYKTIPGASAPSWMGITPGITTKSELISILREPYEIISCNPGKIGSSSYEYRIYKLTCKYGGTRIYRYPVSYDAEGLGSSKYYLFHDVYIRSNVVILIAENYMSAPDEYELKNMKKIFRFFGKPEDVAWSRRSISHYAIMYCEKGQIVHGRVDLVQTILYFAPVKHEDCYDQFRYEITVDNPYEGSDVAFRYGNDPWGIMGD